MTEASVQRILAAYGLQAAAVYPVQKGYRNESYAVRLHDARTLNLILYKSEPNITDAIRRANNVGTFLAARRFPVRAPLDGRIVKLSAGGVHRYACLYNFLPGETIPWEAYTQKHIKLLGQVMAEIHGALEAYIDTRLPRVADEYAAIVGRMQRYFAGGQVSHAMVAKLGLTISEKVFTRELYILRKCEKLRHQQALHMDFVRSNVLFSAKSGPYISGIIDFEKTAFGHPLFDVARTLAFLLVDCKYKPAEKVRKYFLDSGYRKRGRRRLERVTVINHGKQIQLLEELVDIFLVYDFYKFLRHNPYECLSQNEHFMRTRNLLLERGVITTTPIGSPLAESLLQ